MNKTTMNRSDLITTRDYTDADKALVFSTWLKGIYYGDWYQNIPKAIFMENYRALLDRFLAQPGTKIKIACLKEDPDVILGYSVYHTKNYKDERITALDWIYVKAAWRSTGIAKMLLPREMHAYTHMSKSGGAIAKQKYPHLIFNPFILF
jgi:GNAT superfamily N-acetyltransferase